MIVLLYVVVVGFKYWLFVMGFSGNIDGGGMKVVVFYKYGLFIFLGFGCILILVSFK